MLGNYEGPHHYDVPLADIVDIIFSGRPASIPFGAANPRHGLVHFSQRVGLIAGR
jgi:hypothetical protein